MQPEDWGAERLEIGRRQFLAGALAGSLGFGALGERRSRNGAGLGCCSGADPLACIRSHRFDAMVAYFEAQLYALWNGPPGDSAYEVAVDALDFLRYLPRTFHKALCSGLAWLNWYSFVHTKRRFARLSISERWSLLNQGEWPMPQGRRAQKKFPLILWDVDYPLHTAVSTMAMFGRLIIGSRRPANHFIGCTWSAPCRDPNNLVHIETPTYPDLGVEYDVCVIGSGASGAMIAARAAAAGKRVLIVESGKWISPDALVEREYGRDGQVEVVPARTDRVLKELYRDAGGQVAGDINELLDARVELLLPRHRQRIPPQQNIVVLQAQVVGGGPYVNNAIYLEIEEDVWNRWPIHPTGVTYADLWQRMQQIKQILGVNTVATERCAGERGVRFAEGAALAGDPAKPLPVSILESCSGCGADNSVDPFGMHTGGLHPPRVEGPNSFLMQALLAEVPAEVAYQTSAIEFDFAASADGSIAVRHLVVEDRRGVEPGSCGVRGTVRAKQYVLCAGASASTKLLQRSFCNLGLIPDGLGEGLVANVGAPMFAIYDQPIYKGEGERPEPGITQCYFVRERVVQDPDGTVHHEPVLENWFHFPGTVALGLSGWFHEFARAMRKYNHIAMAGMVVPTAVRPENRIRPNGDIALTLNDSEFELLLRGLLRIGQIFLAAATPENGVSLYLPTKAVMLDSCGRPIEIRNEQQLREALEAIRCRGPAFLSLLTSHPQGGNALGRVVDPTTFRVRLSDGGQIQNLYVADASIFPAGCDVNPQLTLNALASYAADAVLSAGARERGR